MKMKKYLLSIIALFFPFMGIIAQSVDDPIFVENELYVKLKVRDNAQQDALQYYPNPQNGGSGSFVWNIIKEFGGESMVHTFPNTVKSMRNVYRVKLKPGSDMQALIKELRANPEVERVNQVVAYYIQKQPNELDESRQWYFKNINMKTSWSTTQGIEKNIAIIDNGVRYTHEDLRTRIMISTEVSNDGIDNDGNGYIDDYYGWDVADNDADPSPRSKPNNPPPGIEKNALYASHGTHVAGIVAAADNNIGVASLGINNRILCIKAHRSAELNDRMLTNVADAFAYAIHKKVDIINCSFGVSEFDTTLKELIEEAISAGIIVVAAAGNRGTDAPMYPAAYDGVIAVGATDKENKKAAYSNFGDYIDVMAPGDDILSTVATGDSQYATMSGTSMAAPIVSSLIGLILSKEPDKVHLIEGILKGGCEDINFQNPTFQGRIGAGLVNVDKTFEKMMYYTSVAEHFINKDFAVYPNPSSGDIFVPYQNLAPNGGSLAINLYNTAGALVFQTEVNAEHQPINVSQLPVGIYTIAATNSTGSYYSSRLLVQR